MIKKIALIILFLGVTVGMAFLLYRFFFIGEAPSTVTTPPVTEPVGGLPTSGEAQPGESVKEGEPGGLVIAPDVPGAEEGAVATPGITALASADTVAVSSIATSGGLNYYNSEDDRFYKIDGEGNAVRLSERGFPSVSDATWSPDGSKAVIEFPDQTKVVYDFDLEKQVTLPKHWEDFAFNENGDTIIAKSIGLDPANRWLIAAASDGTGARLIEPLGENEDKVIVSVSPSASIIAFSDTAEPVGFDSRDLLPIGQNGENIPSLRVEGFDFIPQWSPEGSRLLYSVAAGGDDYLPALWAVRADGTSVGGGRTKLAIRTWADKCTFAGNDTLYCAEPISLPPGAGLQRDIADDTPDRLLKVDLASGTVRNVTPEGFSATVNTIKVSDDGSSLFLVGSAGGVTKVDLF